MAFTRELRQDVLDAISSMVGARLVDLAKSSGGVSPLAAARAHAADAAPWGEKASELAESFPLWMLDPNSLTPETNDLRIVARPTRRWHHQIRLPNGTWSHARSEVRGDEADPRSWFLQEVVSGYLAMSIDRAIAKIDMELPDSYVARLLSIPAYLINVFWLLDEQSDDQRFFLIPSPGSPGRLKSDALLEASQFLALLRSHRPVQGLVDDVTAGAPAPSGRDVGRNLPEIGIQIRVRFKRR
jgi:hypothetical protein